MEKREAAHAPAKGNSTEDRLGRAVDYLEARLDGSLGPAEAGAAAEAAGWSKWHFMRLFQAASGMPVAEYVRSRRLARAARTIAGDNCSILEIALESGYESQAAFTRAFTRCFGLAPTAYRRACAAGRAPRIRLQEPFEPRLPFEAPEPMVRLEETPALDLLGVSTMTSVHAYESFKELPLFWDDWMHRRRWRELPLPPMERPLYGICGPTVDAEFEYAICVEAPASISPPPGWKRFTLRAGPRAIFSAEGELPAAVQGATLAAYAKWLPASGMERGEGWDIEVYYPGDPGSPCRSEVRIPLARWDKGR